jgi:hypothetical protein
MRGGAPCLHPLRKPASRSASEPQPYPKDWLYAARVF